NIVIGKYRRKQFGRRDAHAIEQGEGAVAMPEQTQHRHHPVDRVEELRGGLQPARGIGLPQGKQIWKQVEQNLRIAADVAAVGKNLTIDLLRKQFRAFASEVAGAFRAKAEFGERDRGKQARFANEPAGDFTLQEQLSAAEAFHETAIEGAVGAIENHRGLRQKGEHAPRRDLRLPGRNLAWAARQAQKIIDEGAGIGARHGGVGGAQMAQPAKTRERPRPGRRYRLDLERRAAMRVDDLAAQSKIAGINVRREGWIARPYILRGDQKSLGRPPSQPDRRMQGRAEAAPQSQSGAGGKKTRDVQP